jgi:hypothetical protein
MFDDGGVRVTSSLSSQEKVVKAKNDRTDNLNIFSFVKFLIIFQNKVIKLL